MTIGEWEERAEACRLAGVPLRIGPDEYAGLVRLKLCSDYLHPEDASQDLFGVPLIVT